MPNVAHGDVFPAARFFGHVAIDDKTEQLTMTLGDVGDNALWSKTLDPQRG